MSHIVLADTSALFNVLKYHHNIGIVMANDPKSLAGIEYHTPSSPKNNGKTYAMGNNRKS